MFGHLAKTCCGLELPLQVLQSAAGFDIGTSDPTPVTRESEYWPTVEQAQNAGRNVWSLDRHANRVQPAATARTSST